ncbi:N-formylglutamate deformylase [Rhodoferax sp.]|uniref:N-formylglutamate deformylase n=1 Tax=Rhodoferax sp. TaxID=50421 RepID=UPI002749D980|nr:N-formylglutamate deformylase [Rhodoferax sp.]
MGHNTYSLYRGNTPLLISLPHVGTVIPDALRADMVERAGQVEDTDWHLESLYAFARTMGASMLVPLHSRYVIDLNRPPENTPMYAGVNNTELCPTRFFTGEALYRSGREPTPEQIAQRREAYWRPYHAALAAELARLKTLHGHAVLFDGHSIKSELPWLFEGHLPDLNLGTMAGASCADSLRLALMGVLSVQRRFSHVVDARFKGGYITRHYGRPSGHLHAVQLEMCWRCYMEETPPFTLDAARLAPLHAVLRGLVRTLISWKPHD